MALRALFTVALVACGCAREAEQRPNVVLIVVDTLRADRLPFYGCPENTAPFLSELAERSLVFENAWSPASWTLPATISVLTSVHPFQHGVGNLDGLELGPDDEPIPVNCIPEQLETLAETMGSAGYRTFGIASNVLVGTEVGFDRGFDRFVKLEDEDADAVNAVVESWRDDMLAEEPYFLYVHYIDPHDTFHAREPWFDSSRSGSDTGWPDGRWDDVASSYTDLDWILTRLEPGPEWLGDRQAADLSPEDLGELVRWMQAAYDSEIGFVDSRIRALFEMLDMDQSVVLFLADHGEEFYEHGDLTHGQNLYGETVRVPLLLYLPKPDAPRGPVTTNVTTLDVVPTLRSLLQLPPSKQDQGQDLLAAAAERPVVGFLAGKSGQHALDNDLRSIVVERHRLIDYGEGHVELYDIAADPQEREDLAEQLPEVVAELLQELERIQRSAPAYPPTTRIPVPPSEAMLEHLRGIGYSGGD
jgi:choline-sulfatase